MRSLGNWWLEALPLAEYAGMELLIEETFHDTRDSCDVTSAVFSRGIAVLLRSSHPGIIVGGSFSRLCVTWKAQRVSSRPVHLRHPCKERGHRAAGLLRLLAEMIVVEMRRTGEDT